MQLYQLRSRQVFPISKQEAWDFLSNPANLKVITPEHMGFHILDGADTEMFPGQLIQYIVKPFPFYTVKWVTEITHVSKGNYFVDEQRFGPYSLWHHKHFLKELDNGVEMLDVVDYKLPFGILGQLMHPFLVKKELQKIFAYREEKLTELFGTVEGETPVLELKSI
ncbi:SRPBCC family protein [Flagellimonas meridianipacifica]|uniref:Ligand-binding SRPBCC domain-containing protein n=1 Tax=Flagellimonas meridianipacifica TaxID=1080225 RepID=A0A2T0MCH2_9FLAO|nr:SRPBCC family protein [Allomuricauda pacifica]PRX55197.1 ligand-binding SRPBCC domain-containing protein [Allomuricauda pacifica]